MGIDRKTLYEQVWTTPVSRLCKEYGLSDVGFAKICKCHNIPRPPRGYWEKTRNGKAVRKRPLPEVSDPRLETITIQVRPHSPRQEFPEDVRRRLDAEKKAESRIIVPGSPESPHPLVARTMTSLRSARVDERGLASPKASNCLKVSVSPGCIGRAISILDTLIKAFEARGFRMKDRDGEPAVLVPELPDDPVTFRLEERVRRVQRAPIGSKRDRPSSYFEPRVQYDFFPTGELCLALTSASAFNVRKSWRDGKRRRVEDQLNDFVQGVIRCAHFLRGRKLEEERRKKQHEEYERRRRELERLRWEEEERLRKLEAALLAWEQAQRLRAFLAAIGERAEGLGIEIPEESGLGGWMKWVEGRAERLDPIPGLLVGLKPRPEVVSGQDAGTTDQEAA